MQRDIDDSDFDEAMYQQQPSYEGLQPYQIPERILSMELNFEEFLENLKKKLGGMESRSNPETRQIEWVRVHDPWMNDKGISRILAIIRGHVDVNTFLSNLLVSEIDGITHSIADEVTMVLSNKCLEFDIDPTYLGSIHSIIVNTIYMALKRALGSKTLNAIHSSTHRVENYNPSMDNRGNNKPFGIFKGW